MWQTDRHWPSRLVGKLCFVPFMFHCEGQVPSREQTESNREQRDSGGQRGTSSQTGCSRSRPRACLALGEARVGHAEAFTHLEPLIFLAKGSQTPKNNPEHSMIDVHRAQRRSAQR